MEGVLLLDRGRVGLSYCRSQLCNDDDDDDDFKDCISNKKYYKGNYDIPRKKNELYLCI